MAKLDSKENLTDTQTWSTWEELLLACAVHRYGADSWDSVAAEVQKRSSALRSVTALACQEKYVDLKRRFSGNDDGSETANETIADVAAVPWLDQLRKLRVAELRRDVERYDLSISSLQMKVKKLEEEREHSLKENESETEHSDLEKIKGEKKEKNSEPDSASGEPVSERPNRSLNGSNSTDPKADSPGTGLGNGNKKRDAFEPEAGQPNWICGDAKTGGEDSCRGSCEESAANLKQVVPEREEGNSPESVAESKGKEAKENSDVQSSASLPRKEKKAAKPDNDDQSPAIKRIADESQPLADFLEILQSHMFGSPFSRRLESQMLQETPDQSKLIKQNIDFETIRARLEEGWYLGSNIKFFRDLLVLVNNAQLVYAKGSPEFEAAVQLRQLVQKEMAQKLHKQNSPPKGKPKLEDSKPDVKPSHPLSLKPRMSVPLIACRKRSSLTARSSTSASGPDSKTLKTAVLIDEKPVFKEAEEVSNKDDEHPVSRKKARERPSSSAKKVNRRVKSRVNTNTSSNIGFPCKGQSSNDSSESKKADHAKRTDKNFSSKKQSAASFLKRLNGGSSSDNGSLSETVKSSAMDSSNSKRGETEQKKTNGINDKGEIGKGQSAPKRSNVKKQSNENGKKNTGQATKRGTTPSSSLPTKRAREAAKKEANSSNRAKKRSRR